MVRRSGGTSEAARSEPGAEPDRGAEQPALESAGNVAGGSAEQEVEGVEAEHLGERSDDQPAGRAAGHRPRPEAPRCESRRRDAEADRGAADRGGDDAEADQDEKHRDRAHVRAEAAARRR